MSAEFARHAGYIAASYAAALVILGALIVRTAARHRRARARLAAMGEDHG